MSILHVTQIRSTLAKLIGDRITLDDLPVKATDHQKEDAAATRGLAAYAVSLTAEVDVAELIPCVTDGFGDNGLDVVYFEPHKRRLYVGQAKFSKSGKASIDLGETLKFIAGVRDLLDLNLEAFSKNSRIVRLWPIIKQAVEEASTRIVLVLAHTSVEPLSAEVMRRLNEVVDDINDASEIAELRIWGQADIHDSLSGRAAGASINLDAMIVEWGQVKEPYQAYYGQINAADLAGWHAKHGDRLFSENIRKALGNTEANRQIADSARTTPEHFWYFNNGVTVLCKSIGKKLLGGGGKDSAVLECNGVTIVNGAQTVASIASAYSVSEAEVKKARVLIRFISLENCPAGFSIDVTRATNIQNRVEHRDFASLDPLQERIRRELLLDGKAYAYKTGDRLPPGEPGCTMEEATIALACSLSDVAIAVMVKNSIGRAWENLENPKSLYKRLFHSKITGIHLWRKIEIMRSVEETLRHESSLVGGRERGVAVHGNRFVASEVFRRLDLSSIDEPAFDLDQAKSEAKRLAAKLLPLASASVAKTFPKAYPQSLFKNASRCSEVSAEMAHIEKPRTQRENRRT